MGLDQQVFIIKNKEKLQDFYLYNDTVSDSTLLFDTAKDPKELYLHNQYAVQGFIKKIALKKGLSKDEMYGAYIRMSFKDVKELYKITENLDILKAYAEEWRKNIGNFYSDFDQEQIRKFCHEIAKYIAFDDYAAYYESDW